ncbi:uncharacterized protein ISCGN_008041 [Ixodes scapularis]
MSADQPDFGALIMLADVATGGQPLAAPLPPVGYPATGSVSGRWFAPTLASGLSREVRTLAEDPMTPSPFRDPGQARPTPGAPSTLKGNAVGNMSGPPSGYSAPSLHPRDSVSQRADVPHDDATRASPLRDSIRARDAVTAPIRANPAGDLIELPSNVPQDPPGHSIPPLGGDSLPNGLSGVSPLPDFSPSRRTPAATHSGNDLAGSHDALLQEATRIIGSPSGAMQAILTGPRGMRSPVRIPIPKYKGYESNPTTRPRQPLSATVDFFEFTRMPFGLTGAPMTSQRLMDRVLGEARWSYAMAYRDDIVVYSDTFEDHMRHLEDVLERLRAAGITLNPNKAQVPKTRISLLGFTIDRGHRLALPGKTPGTSGVPGADGRQLSAPLYSMINFYCQFIPGCAAFQAPLSRLLRKSAKWDWGPEQQDAFGSLAVALVATANLKLPDLNRSFVIQTDASVRGLGAVLLQEHEGALRPVALASRSLTPAETRYTVTVRECLAMVFALRKFDMFVDGTTFVIETDHAALRWLTRLREPAGRLARCALTLQRYDYVVRYRKGSTNVVADAVSRAPVACASPAESESQTKSVIASEPRTAPSNGTPPPPPPPVFRRRDREPRRPYRRRADPLWQTRATRSTAERSVLSRSDRRTHEGVGVVGVRRRSQPYAALRFHGWPKCGAT